MKRMIDKNIFNLFAKKSEVSSMTLLGTAKITNDDNLHIYTQFPNIDLSKITQKTILIFTYANCFVMGMLSQSGEGRVAGNLVYDASGNSQLGKVKFNLMSGDDGYYIVVHTNVETTFHHTDPSSPTAYLFAFSVL